MQVNIRYMNHIRTNVETPKKNIAYSLLVNVAFWTHPKHEKHLFEFHTHTYLSNSCAQIIRSANSLQSNTKKNKKNKLHLLFQSKKVEGLCKGSPAKKHNNNIIVTTPVWQHTIDGGFHKLRLVVDPIIYKGFMHPKGGRH